MLIDVIGSGRRPHPRQHRIEVKVGACRGVVTPSAALRLAGTRVAFPCPFKWISLAQEISCRRVTMEGTAKSRRTSAHEPLLTRLMKLGAQESLEAPQELAPARQEACKVSSPELRRRASSFE